MKRGKKDSRVPADAAAEQRSTFCPVDPLAIAVIKGVERRKGEPSADTIKCQTRSAGRRLQAEWRSAGQAAPERLIRTCRRAGYLSAPIPRLDDTSWDECQIYLGAEQITQSMYGAVLGRPVLLLCDCQTCYRFRTRNLVDHLFASNSARPRQVMENFSGPNCRPNLPRPPQLEMQWQTTFFASGCCSASIRV